MHLSQYEDNEYLFSPASVTQGHPNEVVDQISDGVWTRFLRKIRMDGLPAKRLPTPARSTQLPSSFKPIPCRSYWGGLDAIERLGLR